MTPDVIIANPLLDVYRADLDHQRNHGALTSRPFGGVDQPWTFCLECTKAGGRADHRDRQRGYSWAIPTHTARAAIARHAPRGVVEIGAGGGYWAAQLRAQGVDVIAYDPVPEVVADGWHTHQWSEVLRGDHHAVADHSDRALLLVWPSYSEPWTDEVLDLYTGDTVIYVGEGSGGCTGTDRMHALLGATTYCWHDDEPCECPTDVAAVYEEVDTVALPQWHGLHDSLTVYRRI